MQDRHSGQSGCDQRKRGLDTSLYVTCYMLHTPRCSTSHDVTLCSWRYLLHVTTPPILHISERGGRLPHVTLHPTEPTNCPINTSWRQPLLRQEIVARGRGRCIEGNNEQESAEWLNAYKPPHNGHLGQQGSTLMSQSLGGKVFFVKMSYDFSMGATTIQYCVKSELFGTFICKFSFPST